MSNISAIYLLQNTSHRMPGIVSTQKNGGKSKLLEAVLNGDARWLLHLLKESEPEQSELDAALHSATWSGKADSVRLLLAAGSGLYSINQHGEPLLVEAVYSGNIDVVRHVLEAGYDVKLMHGGETAAGWSEPLHVAISGRETPDYDIIDVLIDAGLCLECKDVDGDTPLIVSCNMGDLRLTRRLVSAGCQVDAAGYEDNTAIHRAAENGFTDIVELLLESGADPVVVNANGNTPLMVACENGQEAVVRLLLRAGNKGPAGSQARLDTVNGEGKNCLHLAAASGNADLVEPLINAGLSPQAVDSAGNTALIVACWARNFDVAHRLLQAATVQHESGPSEAEFVNQRGELGRTALHWAALHGSIDVVDSLLTVQGLDIDVCDEVGDTPLLLASRAGRTNVLRTLVGRRCDVNARGELGRTALHWVVLAGDHDAVDCLLAVDHLNVSLPDQSGCTPLLLAAANHRYAEMTAIIHAAALRADVNWRGSDGRTALHWICKTGNTDLVRELVAVHADPNIRDNSSDTALLLAVKERHVAAALELIVSGGADIHCADATNGRQALHYAAEFGLTELIRALIDGGSDVSSTDNDGRTALVLSAMNGHEEIVRLFIDSGRCNVNVVDGTQRTSLFYAAQNGLVDTVKRLLDAGADPDQRRSEPSPLIQACRRGSDVIVQLLVGRGAGINYRDARRRTALMWASEGGHDQIVASLLAASADPKAEDSTGDTALTISTWHCHRAVVRLLLPVSDLEHRERDEGMTALQLAVAKDSIDIVTDLLDAGANVNTVDSKGNNTLLTAMMHTSGSEIVRLILDRGTHQGLDVDFRGDQGRSALHWAVGDPECLRLVLDRRPDLDAVDANGASAILLAIAHSRADSAKLLIDAGCDFKKIHKDGRSAIHHAAIYGVCETVEDLLGRGVAADTPTTDGKTPVLLAAIEGHADIVQVLIRYRCDVNRVYQDAMTPLSAAASGQHHQVLEVLLVAGADPNQFGSKKCSPLMTSILNKDVRGTVTLIQHGARLDQTLHDDNSKRPIHAAIVNNYLSILYILVAAESDVNALRALLRDGVVYYFVSDARFLAVLRQAAGSPRSLQAICRQAVRRRLPLPLLANIGKLPVPPAMMDYLAMKDLDKVSTESLSNGQQSIGL
jgi:ankyrin repeat protein